MEVDVQRIILEREYKKRRKYAMDILDQAIRYVQGYLKDYVIGVKRDFEGNPLKVAIHVYVNFPEELEELVRKAEEGVEGELARDRGMDSSHSVPSAISNIQEAGESGKRGHERAGGGYEHYSSSHGGWQGYSRGSKEDREGVEGRDRRLPEEERELGKEFSENLYC